MTRIKWIAGLLAACLTGSLPAAADPPPYDAARTLAVVWPNDFPGETKAAAAEADPVSGLVMARSSINDRPPLGLPGWLGFSQMALGEVSKRFTTLPPTLFKQASAIVRVAPEDVSALSFGSAYASARAHLNVFAGGTCGATGCTGTPVTVVSRDVACHGQIPVVDPECVPLGAGTFEVRVVFPTTSQSTLWLVAGVNVETRVRGAGAATASLRATVEQISLSPYSSG